MPLLTGYVFQAAALDRGRLAIIQPLLVTTVIFALPLGYFLTHQHVGKREVIGALVIILGLGLFAYFGDPAGGNENAPNDQWAVAIGILAVICVVLLVFARQEGDNLTIRAAAYGTVSGILFGLSASLTKPTLDGLHDSVGTMLSHWYCYALAITGILGFVLQQVSLGTGASRLPSPPSRSRTPIVGILIGVILLDERLRTAELAHRRGRGRPRRSPSSARS